MSAPPCGDAMKAGQAIGHHPSAGRDRDLAVATIALLELAGAQLTESVMATLTV